MDIGKVIDIEYETGYIKYEKIRKGILQNKDKLSEIGYKCIWKEDLDLNSIKREDSVKLFKEKGYMKLGDHLITAFEKDGLPFKMVIFLKSQRAKIHGENHIYQNEYDQVRKNFDKFEKITGVHLNLKQTSEPY